MNTTFIEVGIDNFKCDERYYSFDYTIQLNGKLIKEGTYDNDHCWSDLKAFRNMMLNDKEAVKLILEQL